MDEISDVNETVEQHEIAVADGLTEGSSTENKAASMSAVSDVANEVSVAQPMTSGETISLVSDFERVETFELDLKLESEQATLSTKSEASPAPSDDSEPSFVILNEESESLTAVSMQEEHKPADLQRRPSYGQALSVDGQQAVNNAELGNETTDTLDKQDECHSSQDVQVAAELLPIMQSSSIMSRTEHGDVGSIMTEGESKTENDATDASENDACNLREETVRSRKTINLQPDLETVIKPTIELKPNDESSSLSTKCEASLIVTDGNVSEKLPTGLQRRSSYDQAMSTDGQVVANSPELDREITNTINKEDLHHFSLCGHELATQSEMGHTDDAVEPDDEAAGDVSARGKNTHSTESEATVTCACHSSQGDTGETGKSGGKPTSLQSVILDADKPVLEIKLEDEPKALSTKSEENQLATDYNEHSYVFVNENGDSLPTAAIQIGKQPTGVSCDGHEAVNRPDLNKQTTDTPGQEDKFHSSQFVEETKISSTPVTQTEVMELNDHMQNELSKQCGSTMPMEKIQPELYLRVNFSIVLSMQKFSVDKPKNKVLLRFDTVSLGGFGSTNWVMKPESILEIITTTKTKRYMTMTCTVPILKSLFLEKQHISYHYCIQHSSGNIDNEHIPPRCSLSSEHPSMRYLAVSTYRLKTAHEWFQYDGLMPKKKKVPTATLR